MGSVFAHISIGMLAMIFPNTFNFGALVLASVFPDLEYFHLTIINFIKKRKLSQVTQANLGMLYFHSLLLTLVVSLPVCLYLSMRLFDDTFRIIFWSVVLGLLSHLVLDMPAHIDLMLFWPFKRISKNPMLLKPPRSVYRLYDALKVKKFETYRYQHVQTLFWLLLSNFLIVIFGVIYYLT